MAADTVLDCDWNDDDWEPLIDTIYGDKCVLMLGPDIAIPEGESISLSAKLANQFAEYLENELSPREFRKIDPDNLPRVAHIYGRQKGGDNYPRSRAKNFFQTNKDVTSSLYQNLAALPFRMVITSSHDEMFLRALEGVNKTPQVRWYNFLGNQEDIIPAGTVESPMVYYLYGSTEAPESMVLTENDLLDFLVSVIKGEPALPDNVRSMFHAEEKCYLFFGFGFCNWYLRILLHVMQKKKKNSSVALEKFFEEHLRELESNAFFFKKSGHNLRIVDKEAGEFAETLNQKYFEQYGEGKDSCKLVPTIPIDAPLVFISHARENKDQAAVLCKNLEGNGIRVWLDKKDLYGGDDFGHEIEITIKKEIDYFIFVNSAELNKRNEGYVIRELKTALDREKEFRQGLSFIIPVTFDGTPEMAEIGKSHQISMTGPDNVADLVTAIRRDQARRQKR